MPPVWMWPLDDELKIHFERVDEERKAKYGAGSGDSDTGDDDAPGSSMMSNEYAKGRR